MDYDTRIGYLETIIEQLSSATTINQTCPVSISSTYWDQSKSREAAVEQFVSMDKHLRQYSDAYDDLLEALEARKQVLVQTKLELFSAYSRRLTRMTPEERSTFFNETTIDASVKAMLERSGQA
ncbi:MAG TPA: hypothetical protein VK119_10285 [Bacillota bacterium]|nr:hypothetical protein [Bacillota bacterium]